MDATLFRPPLPIRLWWQSGISRHVSTGALFDYRYRGPLSDEDADEVLAHVASCGTCRARLWRLEEVPPDLDPSSFIFIPFHC